MRWWALVFACAVLCVPASLVSAGSPASRHKPGPTFTRGVVISAGTDGFVLRTTHATFQVLVVAATSVTEKGKSGRVVILVGDHVGVRGFVEGSRIRAIYVHIYPRKAKPKPYTIRGTISSVRGATVVIEVGSQVVTVALTAQTAIRIGSNLSTAAVVSVGAHVQVRVARQGARLVAIRIHVYRRKASGKHLRVHGTVASVAPRSIGVRSGSRVVAIRTTSSTRVYAGNKRSTPTALRAGATVTIYACCRGGALVATSIHVHKPASGHGATTLLRGWVQRLGAGSMSISTTAGPIEISTDSATRYTVGVTRLGAGGVRVGDEISVRAVRANNGWQAVSVHVYLSSRRSRTVVGVVVAVSPTRLVVLSRGKRYTVLLGAHPTISLAGRHVASWSLLPGDHVRAVGRLTGPASLAATRITARRVAAKKHIVRGTITSVGAGTMSLVDAGGVRHQILITTRTLILVHGRRAARSLLFVGIHATARCLMVNGRLVADRISLTLVARTMTGRVVRVTRWYLLVRRGTTEITRIDLPSGMSVMDGSQRVTVGIGADVQAAGYEVHTGEIRAISVRVVHLAVGLSGTAVAGRGTLTLRTSQGQRYRLRITSSTQVSTGHDTIELTASSIPEGARIRVQGVIGADGSVTVSQLTIRLTSLTLRGTVTAIMATSLTVTTPSGPSTVRLSPAVTYAQGTHPMNLSGVVPGDDVTVYGYDGGHGIVLARKILVHRRIAGMDGTVASLTAGGFILTAADGPHAVILTSTTVFTGLTPTTIVVGMAVHVTGYRRGDGSVLATRVRIGKAKHDDTSTGYVSLVTGLGRGSVR